VSTFHFSILVGIIGGVSVGRFFGEVCLKRDTLKQALKLRMFSADTLVAVVVSFFIALVFSPALNYFCLWTFFYEGYVSGHYLLATAVGGGAAVLTSVITAAAVLRHPQSLVIGAP
jgi:hypothetical protein